MDLATFFKAEFAEHHDVARRSEAALSDSLAKLVGACVKSVRAGGKLLFFGNGGSAADAQHLATELTIRYKANRAAIAAIALTTDTSALTAAGNDLGFDRIFSRQIEALGRAGDVAIAISTSGKSPNVIGALKQAKAMGLVTAALGEGWWRHGWACRPSVDRSVRHPGSDPGDAHCARTNVVRRPRNRARFGCKPIIFLGFCTPSGGIPQFYIMKMAFLILKVA